MKDTEMIEFLLENSVHIKSELTGYCMIADEMYELGGEFVVYKSYGGELVDLYRGKDLKEAMRIMDGNE